MVIELVKVVQSVGGNAHVTVRDAQITLRLVLQVVVTKHV